MSIYYLTKTDNLCVNIGFEPVISKHVNLSLIKDVRVCFLRELKVVAGFISISQAFDFKVFVIQSFHCFLSSFLFYFYF